MQLPTPARQTWNALQRGGVIFACLMVMGSVAVQAQTAVQSVRGIVRDTSGAPLGGAQISVGRRQTSTNALGVFRIDSVPVGRYPLTVRLLGYAPVRTRVAVVASEPTNLEYFLVRARVVLPTLVVTARRTGIYGTVGDTAYRAAVGASVELLGPGGGLVLTDSMGRFAFPNVGRGSYLIRVNFPGYTERRIAVELNRGEGRELGVLLAPWREREGRSEVGALQDLGRRLSFGVRRERVLGAELTRHGSGNVCDLPQIRSEVDGVITLIVNGNRVFKDLPLWSLCSWRADEVELLELGRDVCAEVTRSIADLLSISCGPRTRNAREGLSSPTASRLAGRSRSYVVIWEKK